MKWMRTENQDHRKKEMLVSILMSFLAIKIKKETILLTADPKTGETSRGIKLFLVNTEF